MTKTHATHITRRNRQTRTLVTVCTAEAEGLDLTTPWFTVCDDHGGAIGHYTKADALFWAAAPASWCDGCSALHNQAD